MNGDLKTAAGRALVLAGCIALGVFLLAVRMTAGQAPVAAATPSPAITATRVAAQPPRPTATPEPGIYAPILMYHHVGNPRAGRYNVSVAQFAAQMRWLRANGFTTVSIDQIAAALRGQAALPPRPVAITFDDSWKNQISNAAPILNQYGFKATFYVIARAVGRGPSLMNWDDLRALAGQGHWIGSHSYSHKTETALGAPALQAELAGARALIQQNISRTATTHAYPYGAVNLRVQAAAAGAGFVAAAGVPSACYQRYSLLYRLNRIEVRGTYPLSTFAGWLTCWGHPPAGVVAPAVTPPPSARRGVSGEE